MRELKYLYEIKIDNIDLSLMDKDFLDDIADEISESICSWEWNNKNENTTQWNSCFYDNKFLVACNAKSTKKSNEIINDIKYSILKDHDIDHEPVNVCISIHSIYIKDDYFATVLVDYTDDIIKEYKKVGYKQYEELFM